MWLARAGIVFRAFQVLVRNSVPEIDEHALQPSHSIALYAQMQVAPLAKLGFALDVVVGHIHAARIGHHAVNDDNLAMVAVEGMVNPGEPYGVELIDFDANVAQGVKVAMLERAIVGPVAPPIEDGAHLHALGCLARKEAKELLGDGVVAEVEIFQVDALAGLRDSCEEVVEECLPL